VSDAQLPKRKPFPPEKRAIVKQRLISDVFGHREGRRPRRWQALAALAAILVIGSASAIALTRGTFATQPQYSLTDVGCYDAPSLDANVTVVANDYGEDPVELCTQLGPNGTAEGGSSSPWTACTQSEFAAGPVSAFPVSDHRICEKFGLRPLPDGYREVTSRIGGLRMDVEESLASVSGCPAPTEAKALVTRTLREKDFAGWSVEVTEQRSEDFAPCALLGFDLENKTVVVNPGTSMED
jgi:hypothetical protein